MKRILIASVFALVATPAFAHHNAMHTAYQLLVEQCVHNNGSTELDCKNDMKEIVLANEDVLKKFNQCLDTVKDMETSEAEEHCLNEVTEF